MHSVTLTWTASADTVDGYEVYRGTTSGGEAATPLNATILNALTYVDTPPGPGTYFYYVKSSAGGVLSVPSAEVKALVPPFPPTALVVSAIS